MTRRELFKALIAAPMAAAVAKPALPVARFVSATPVWSWVEYGRSFDVFDDDLRRGVIYLGRAARDIEVQRAARVFGDA
jgi:hypothetical protein